MNFADIWVLSCTSPTVELTIFEIHLAERAQIVKRALGPLATSTTHSPKSCISLSSTMSTYLARLSFSRVPVNGSALGPTLRRPYRASHRSVQAKSFSQVPYRALYTTINRNYTHRSFASARSEITHPKRSVRYYTSSEGVHLLEGKTESVLSSLWDKYKMYAIGAGGVVAVVSLLGFAASAVAVGGLASLAGGVYLWYTRKLAHRQSVLRVLYEPIIDLHRPKIEKFIGPFELPQSTEVAADSEDMVTASGGQEHVVRNVFYIEGMYGKAMVRALGVRHADGSYTIRKLLIDAQDFRNSLQENIVLVDHNPTFEYVDAVSFQTFDLSDLAEVKRAAKNAKRVSDASKKSSEKKSTLSSNKPKKASSSK